MNSRYNLRKTKERENRPNYLEKNNTINVKRKIKSIKEIKIEVLNEFKKYKNIYSYEEYENNLLSKYDIDPDINYEYLIKLFDYYKKNMNNINNEDEIIKKIFQKIITLPFEKYSIIKNNLLSYKNKLLMKEEIKFLSNYSYKEIFYKII